MPLLDQCVGSWIGALALHPHPSPVPHLLRDDREITAIKHCPPPSPAPSRMLGSSLFLVPLNCQYPAHPYSSAAHYTLGIAGKYNYNTDSIISGSSVHISITGVAPTPHPCIPGTHPSRDNTMVPRSLENCLFQLSPTSPPKTLYLRFIILKSLFKDPD